MSNEGRDQLRKEIGVVLRDLQRRNGQVSKNIDNLLEGLIDNPDIIDKIRIQDLRACIDPIKRCDDTLFVIVLDTKQ